MIFCFYRDERDNVSLRARILSDMYRSVGGGKQNRSVSSVRDEIFPFSCAAYFSYFPTQHPLVLPHPSVSREIVTRALRNATRIAVNAECAGYITSVSHALHILRYSSNFYFYIRCSRGRTRSVPAEQYSVAR